MSEIDLGKIPRLKKEDGALEWVQTALSLGLPMDHVVQCFMEFFPDYRSPMKFETQKEEEAAEKSTFKVLRQRFRDMLKDTRRISYYKVKENKETIRKFLDVIPIASPIVRLIELEMMRLDTSLKPDMRIKLITAADRLTNAMLFDGNGNSPIDLIPTLPKVAKPTSESDTEDPPKKKTLGGAIMNHANSRQKTR